MPRKACMPITQNFDAQNKLNLAASKEVATEPHVNSLQDTPSIDNDLLQLIANTSHDRIAIKNREHHYLMVNDAFAKSLAMTPNDIAGRLDMDLGIPHKAVYGNPETGEEGYISEEERVMLTGEIHRKESICLLYTSDAADE